VTGFDAEARKTLLTHPWPGNVRELRQKIMGAVLQAQTGVVMKEHLELAVTKPTSPVSFALRNDAEDKERILRALKQANGNRKVATLCLIEVSFLCAVRTRKRAFDMSEECRGRKVFGE
jgi:two-component system, NtrC family, response regulator HydG